MSERVADILSRYQTSQTRHADWESFWQELGDVLHPVRATFTANKERGGKRNTSTYDSTPQQARRGLATAIDALIKPKTSKWFSIRASDDDLNEDDEAKVWFQQVQRRMWGAIYAKGARFIQRSGEVDNDLVTFGTGALWIDENKNRDGLIFRSLHLRDYFLEENEDGVIDTIYLRLRYTASQAINKWGKENVGETVREAAGDEARKDEKLLFVQAVIPNHDPDARRFDHKGMPFLSLIIHVESKTLVSEGGFREFPAAVPRWETSAGEVYGRSPGMVALPDSNTLQAMGKTLLVAGQKAVDPPMWGVDDAVIGTVRTFPGGFTIVDADAARAMKGSPLGVLEFGKNIPLGREMQNDVRQQIEAALFKNVFNLPIGGPLMTATEILERKEEFIRTIGPVFGQLEPDYIGHTVERVFGIMLRAGAFPPLPDVLVGRDIQFEFQSPIQMARKQVEAASVARGFELLAPLIQVQPEIMDNFNGDAIARDIPDIFGSPLEWLNPIEKVREIREARQAAQQEQAILDAGQQIAETASQPGIAA